MEPEALVGEEGGIVTDVDVAVVGGVDGAMDPSDFEIPQPANAAPATMSATSFCPGVTVASHWSKVEHLSLPTIARQMKRESTHLLRLPDRWPLRSC